VKNPSLRDFSYKEWCNFNLEINFSYLEVITDHIDIEIIETLGENDHHITERSL
jgi:hypothetical protein